VWAQRFGGSLLDGSTVAGQGMAAAVALDGAALVAASFQGSLRLADAAGQQATLTAGVQPGLFLSNAFVLKLSTTGSVQVVAHFDAPKLVCHASDQARPKGSRLHGKSCDLTKHAAEKCGPGFLQWTSSGASP
jgi:hypothetical protein